jgi:hypothetical protein
MFSLKWYRNAVNETFTLVDTDLKPFPLKPGNTWFEVVGTTSEMQSNLGETRFIFKIP